MNQAFILMFSWKYYAFMGPVSTVGAESVFLLLIMNSVSVISGSRLRADI